MHEEPLPPVTPVIPPPDLASPPPTPAPDQTDPVPAASLPPVTSAVPVRVIDAAPSEAQAGSPAPFNTRIIAVLIDMVVMVGLQMSVAWILPDFASKIAWLVGLAYLVTRDSLPFLGGQSVGKKAMKLKVVTQQGASLVNNWEAALIRNAVLAIPLFGLVEVIILLTREDKPERGLRLGDEWAKTKVIVAPAAI
jgi:uncharacterized RDD family membrane protein YckC